MICRRCGAEIDTKKRREDGSLVCPSCGVVYRPGPSADPEQKTASGGETKQNTPGKKGKKESLAVFLAVAILLLAAALGSYFLFFRANTVSFSLGYETESSAPAKQKVKRGDHALEPPTPMREGYIFIGWYTAEAQARPYDFRSTVRKSFTLTGRWADRNDRLDSDGDGLTDSIENSIETDVRQKDTDGDGLSDRAEFQVLRLDPLSRDTDGNGIPDGSEDADGDGLTNAEEVTIGTSPISMDTDGDGLTDRQEYREVRTSPVDRDTDMDGADDGTEVRIGSDPLSANAVFTTAVSAPPVSEENPVSLSVSAETDSSGAGSVTVTPVSSTNIPALSAAAYGYLGNAYEVHTDGSLAKATLTFRYDLTLGTIGEDFMPCVYYYDEEARELVELEEQHAENGTVTAVTTHFSYYTVMNKVAVDTAKKLAGIPTDLDLTDRNNDGLPDVYAEWINAGDLRYDNSDTLVGVLDLYGRENDDWDGDGLKNGEEISVSTGYFNAWIQIRSNPILRDSDFDGLSDFVELRQFGSDPMRYDRRSVGALRQLMNDGQYLYANHEKNWQDHLALFFDGDKYGKAKQCLIEYLYDFAPEETIEKNAEQIAQRAAFEKTLEVYGALSSVAKATLDLKDTLSIGLDDAIMDQGYFEITQARINILNGLNGDVGDYAKEMDDAWLDSILDSVSALSFPDTLNKTLEDYGSGELTQQTKNAMEIIGIAEKALKAYYAARDFESLDLAREISDYSQQVDRLRGQVSWTAPSPAGMAITVSLDMVKTGAELQELYNTYSKVKANADAFNMYLELLLYIRDNAEADYVRNAAADLARMVVDNGGGEFYAQLADACGKKLTAAAFKTTLDVLAKMNPLAAIGKVFLDLYKETGMTDLAKYNVYFDVMREVSRGSEAMLEKVIREEEQTFSYRDKNAEWVEKYLVQLAQSRIVGEYYYSEYCASDSGAAKLANVLSGKNTSDYREWFREEAKQIYSYANRLQLKLSKNLPYHAEFWSDTVPEDALEISTTMAPEDYPEVCRTYLELLIREREEINGYNWQMGYYGYGVQTEEQIAHPVVLCNIRGDPAPELLYVKRENDYMARLVIVAFENGRLRELYSGQWDILAGGGQGYYLYQLNGEPQLYVFMTGGDMWWRGTYYSMEENADGMLELTKQLMKYEGSDDGGMTSPPEFEKNGEPVTQEEFEREQLRIRSETSSILMYNRQAGDFVSDYTVKHECPAMTCDEAIAYLRGLLG